MKELRIAAEDTRPLVISGPLAAQLEKELSRGAAPGAVRVDGRPEDAAVLVRVLAGAPTPEDEKVLRAAERADVPVVVVQTGTEFFDVPYVLATEVVMCSPGSGFPVEEIAGAIAARIGESGTGLAARLPVAPRAVERRADREVLAPERDRRGRDLHPGRRLPGADAEPDPARPPAGGSAHGVEIDQDRWPEVLATIGAALGFRTVARQLLGAVPVAGWLVKGTVAYAGTRAVGEAAHRYFHSVSQRKTRNPRERIPRRAKDPLRRPPTRPHVPFPAEIAALSDAVRAGPSVLGTPIWREAKWLVPSTPRNC